MVSSLTIRKQYFVAINLLGKWGYMQKIMAIMSEGLPQKLKCIKMGHEEWGFQAFLKEPPLCQEESMYWERLFDHHEQSDYSKGIIKVAHE